MHVIVRVYIVFQVIFSLSKKDKTPEQSLEEKRAAQARLEPMIHLTRQMLYHLSYRDNSASQA